MKKIFLATKNKGKIKEMKEILSGFKDIEIVSFLDDIETPEIVEDGTTFEENSQKKALEIAKFLNMYTIADDSGISVETLGGAPGIYSARYSGENATAEENLNKLLEVMRDKENKKAKYVAVITIASPELEYKSFRGELEGEIISQKRGTNGFGYDPIFYLKDYDKTTAEISAEEKNKISHRGKALQQLKSHIEDFIK